MYDVAVGLQRWPGSRLLRRAIDASDPRSESALESWSRGCMIERGLPTPVLQYPVEVDGYVMRCDFAFLEERVIGEADGRDKYGKDGDPLHVIEAEKRRQSRLQSRGFTVYRWGWHDVAGDIDAWVRGLRAALRRRR